MFPSPAFAFAPPNRPVPQDDAAVAEPAAGTARPVASPVQPATRRLSAHSHHGVPFGQWVLAAVVGGLIALLPALLLGTAWLA